MNHRIEKAYKEGSVDSYTQIVLCPVCKQEVFVTARYTVYCHNIAKGKRCPVSGTPADWSAMVNALDYIAEQYQKELREPKAL